MSYNLAFGYIIFRPYTSWYQTVIEGTTEIGKLYLSDGRVLPKINGTSIQGMIRHSHIRFLKKVMPETLKKILEHSPEATSFIAGKTQMLGLKYNKEFRDKIAEIPFLTVFGVGIANYLPQRKYSVGDAIPVFDNDEIRHIYRHYIRAKGILQKHFSEISLPEPKKMPEKLVETEVRRRVDLKLVYKDVGVEYRETQYEFKTEEKAKSEEEEEKKDPYRGMIMNIEKAETLMPLISVAIQSELGLWSPEEIGVLIGSVMEMPNYIGPKTNICDIYFVAVFRKTGEEKEVVVAKEVGFDPQVNEEAKSFLDAYVKWLKETDVYGRIVEIVDQYIKQGIAEKKVRVRHQ